jgi:flagellar biosynthesis GTPase FlhF
LPGVQVHLVLNGAYEMDCLYNQLRFFERVGIGDLVISHFEEVVRPEKLWNLALGKRFSIGFLSGGQNVPGEFVEATSGLLFSAQNLP